MGVITFNGVNSDTLGIRVSTFPSYQIPERETSIITIPGKDGEVIQHINFKNVDREYEVSFPVTGDFESQSSEIANWLLSTNGYARLEDTYSPGVYRLGMYKDSDIIENIYNQAGKATIRFSCKPQRFLKIPETPYYYITNNNTEWHDYSLPDSYYDAQEIQHNFTSMPAKPIIKLEGSGDYEFVFGTEPDITYRINNLSTNNKIVIDCENQNVYSERYGTNKNSDFIITGGNEFPYITPGCDFTIRSLNGNWCDIYITPNWWHW